MTRSPSGRPADSGSPTAARAHLDAALDRGEDPEAAARAALRISDECVEAWLVFADCAVSVQEARDRVRKAVEAATRGVGTQALQEGRGKLGETPEGAAYLHALAALARVQVAEDRAAQAIQTLQACLAADPSDPVQVRADLLLLLLATGRDDEGDDLVAAYAVESNAAWMLGRALLRRRRALDEDGVARATRALDEAIVKHPEVTRALAGDDDAARKTRKVEPILRTAWEDTEGALDWVRARLEVIGRETLREPAPSSHASDADRRFTAGEFVEEAWAASGARRAELAHEALERWPDCADAWRAIASGAPSPAAKVTALEKAVEAAGRALGRAAGATVTPVGDSEDARTLLRARSELAHALRAAELPERALDEERRLLAEDPDDPMGVGVAHVARLLAMGRDDEALERIGAREEDAAPGWVWARVLARRRAGDRIATSFALGEAMLVAPLVAPLLLAGSTRVPVPEGMSRDAFEQSRRAADDLRPAWSATPGALDWLRERLPPPRPDSRGGPRRRRGSP